MYDREAKARAELDETLKSLLCPVCQDFDGDFDHPIDPRDPQETLPWVECLTCGARVIG